MTSQSEPTILLGDIMKVVNTNDDSQTVHVRFQNGRYGSINGLMGELPRRGDVILVGGDRWEFAPKEAWPELNSIAVVKCELEDKSLLIDDGLSIKLINNYQEVSVVINNTVEYNDVDGIVRVVGDKPIRSRDFELDSEEALKEYLIDKSGDGPSFKDFGGYPNVIERARELIETQFLRREYLDKIGARPVKGVLFTGPPGTGKTHLARIIAQESKADFFLVSGPSIVSKWVGDSEDTLRKIFEAAAESKSGRAIIFFDEIDSIAERRTGDSHEASKRLVAQLLTLMDGFGDKGKNVVVIAATNRVRSLDPALTRPGRFDWEIEFGTPSLSDRIEILKVGASHLNSMGKLPIEDVAALTEGWSGADLTSIWTEAALLAAGEKRDRIAAEDVAQAYERVVSRPRRETMDGGV